jgi:hypothetical protein
MTARCAEPLQALVVVFERSGAEPVRVDAAGGEKAVLAAVKVLLTRSRLQPGDRLMIEAAS